VPFCDAVLLRRDRRPTYRVDQAGKCIRQFCGMARFYARHHGSIKDDSDTPLLLIGAELAAS